MNEPRFIIFTDAAYSELCKVLLDSLREFSQAPVTVIALNHEFKHDHPRLEVKTLTIKCDEGWLASNNIWMTRMEALPDLNQTGVLLDADSVANWNVDELLELVTMEYQSLHQKAVCGFFDEPSKQWLLPRASQVYCNMVPMVLSGEALNWLRQGRAHHRQLRDYLQATYPGACMDDERMINWLRVLADENTTISIAGPDRQLFDAYMGNTRSLQAVQHNGLYLGLKVTWHLFHGEKDVSKARAMFEKLRAQGRDFLYNHPGRARKISIYA